MSQTTSSAEPLTLLRYSDTLVLVDDALGAEANRLRSALEHFEATCREPAFQLRVSHVADYLTQYAQQARGIDLWVRDVAVGFQLADSGGGAYTLAPIDTAHLMPITSPLLSGFPPVLQEIITQWLLEHADEFEDAAELEQALQAYLWSYIDTKAERDAIGKKIDYGQLGISLWKIARNLRVRRGFEYTGEVVIKGASQLRDTVGWSATLTHLAMPGYHNLLKMGPYKNWLKLSGQSALKQGWDALPTSKLGVALATVDVYFAWLDNKEDYASEGAQKIACGTVVDSVIVIGAGAAGATVGSFVGGATLGAALGAVSGGVLAPVGVAVGSVVGGMVGSWAADEIRKTGIDEWATDHLDASLSKAGDALSDASEAAGEALSDASTAAGAALSGAASQVESAFAPAVQSIVNLF